MVRQNEGFVIMCEYPLEILQLFRQLGQLQQMCPSHANLMKSDNCAVWQSLYLFISSCCKR